MFVRVIRKSVKKAMSWLIVLAMAASSVGLMPAASVLAATVNPLAVTLADGNTVTDGKVQVGSVLGNGTAVTSSLYYVLALSAGTAPAQGASIDGITGASQLVLHSDIGPATADNWVRVYETDAAGHITGYGAVRITYANIGTIIYTSTGHVMTNTPSAGGGNTGVKPWTDYTVTGDLTLTAAYNATPSNSFIQLQFRYSSSAPIYYYVQMDPTGGMYLNQGGGTWGGYGAFTVTGDAAGYSVGNGVVTMGDTVRVKITAIGNVITIYAWDLTNGGVCPATPQLTKTETTNFSMSGGVGWGKSSADGSVNNVVVNRIAAAPAAGTPMTGVTIDNTAPAVGDKLTASDDPAGSAGAFQWETYDAANGDVIVGSGAAYTVKAADQGKSIRVTAVGAAPYSGTVTSADTAVVPGGAAGVMETLTPALDANVGAVTDGAIKVASVAGATGTLYYSFGTTAGLAPAYGAPIASVSGTASLTLEKEIGTGLDASYWLRVYDTDASGNVTGFGSIPVTYDLIGTLLYTQVADPGTTNPSNVNKGQSYYVGNMTWTNYIVTGEVTLNWVSSAASPIFQLHFRHGGTSDYQLQMESWGSMVFKGAGTSLSGGYGPSNANDVPTYFKIVANGSQYDIYLTTSVDGSRSPVYPATPTGTVTDGTNMNGGVGWSVYAGTGASQTPPVPDATVKNLVVQRIRSASDPIGNAKPKITGASIRTLNAPATGNYPDTLFNFSEGSGSNQYTETITWSPAVTGTFQANTAYTATVTLTPGSYPGNLTTTTSTFQGVQISDIGNLPASSTYSSLTAALSGDAMVLTIAFKPTAATAGARQLLFSDDFTGTALNSSNWNLAPSWDRQGNSTWNPGNTQDCATTNLVTLDNSTGAAAFLTGASGDSNGNLVLKFTPDPAKSTPTAPQWIDCGAIRTRPRNNDSNLIFGNSTGYYEARIKPAKITGMWGAFWLMSPTQNQNPAAGVYGSEIDILETIGNPTNGFNGAAYWNGYGMPAQNGMAASGSTGSGTKNPTNIGINIYDGDYHTFGLAWSPTQYTWYVDGIPFYSYPATPSNANICQNPDYIKLSLERATFSPPMDASYYVTGQTYTGMTIDWVRVWNQPPAAMSNNASDYVSMNLTPVYNAARDIWQVQAVLTNTQTAGSFSGTVSLKTPAGYTALASQSYGPLAPGASQTLLFDVSRTYASPGASDTATFQYTTDINQGTATGSVTLGSVSALKTAAPVAADGNLNDAVWADAPKIDFGKGATAGTSSTAAGQLAWDAANLYAAVVVTGASSPTDSLTITVNGHPVTTPVSSAAVSGASATYEVAIPWSSVGVTGAMTNGDYANRVSFTINANSGTISYFGMGADQGYLLLLDHVVYPKHIVTFNSNGGWSEPFQEISEGSLVTEPAPAPQKPYGYTFAGWYKDAALTTPWNFAADTMGTADMTLYAKWNLSFTVTFVSNGGSSVAPIINITPNTTVSQPANPTRAGYTFAGWYSDNMLTKSWSFGTPININTTLYANWTLDPSYADASASVKLSLAPIQDSAGVWQIAATLTNVSGAPVSGTVYETAPAQGSPVGYTLDAGASQTVNFPADPANLLAKYVVDYTAGANTIGSASAQFILAPYVSSGITVDGSASDAAWQTAPVIDFGQATIHSDAAAENQPVQNNLDVQANGKLVWDNANLYVTLNVTDQALVQTAATATDIWGQDSLQLRIKNAAGTSAEVGFALSSVTGSILAYEWAGPAVGTLTSANYKAVITRDDPTCTTRYEIAIPWATLGIEGAALVSGDTLPVCLALNDYGLLSTGANGRRQFEYFHGVLATKDAGMDALVLGGASVTPPVPSSDATLASLTVSNGMLTPDFDPSATDYAVSVDNSVDSITLEAMANDAKATVTGTGTKTLAVGPNAFTITVIAEDNTTQTYTVTVTRAAAPLSSDATLASLTVSSGTLTPAFALETLSYTVSVDNTVASITLEATAHDAKATVSGTGPKTLAEGPNAFTITVTAEDGTQMTYTVAVTRAAAPPAKPTVMICGTPVDVMMIKGVATVIVPDSLQYAVVSANLLIDMSSYGSVDVIIPAGWFKDVDKIITIVTANGSGSVTTKQLWNNSDKNRIISMRNGKLSFTNQ